MDKINASITRMKEIEIFGVPALFTPEKVCLSTVHLELFCYEVQARRGSPEQPFCLMETADEDFFGTVLAIAPIPLDEHGRQPIEPRDFIMDTGTGYFTPAEFEEKYMSPYYAPHRRAERYGKPE